MIDFQSIKRALPHKIDIKQLLYEYLFIPSLFSAGRGIIIADVPLVVAHL